eukprot:COSAG02_NODE_14_length_56855_cov_512.793661_20_plen_122_part_00
MHCQRPRAQRRNRQHLPQPQRRRRLHPQTRENSRDSELERVVQLRHLPFLRPENARKRNLLRRRRPLASLEGLSSHASCVSNTKHQFCVGVIATPWHKARALGTVGYVQKGSRAPFVRATS